jgi:hypothetical protein
MMKQMQKCMDKFFASYPHEPPEPCRSSKWNAILSPLYSEPVLALYHYNHLILEYDLKRHLLLFQWWEKQADKRGLDDAKEYLEQRRQKEAQLCQENSC